MSKRILLWFRNDLRLHDNEMLVEAAAKADEVFPLYIFDPRHFEPTNYNSLKTGALRAQFLLESVTALRKSLKGKLYIAFGLPKEIIPQLAEHHQISEVYHHREVAWEDTIVSENVENALWKLKINLKHFIGHTLYNKEDLPFPIKDIPDDFLKFKKKIERESLVKPCFEQPKSLNIITLDDWGELPTLDQLIPGTSSTNLQKSDFKGGEQSALSHLKSYLEQGLTSPVKKQAFFSKLSPWIANGCLSPRYLYWQIKASEVKNGAKPHLQALHQGLLWRDYFRFMLKKHSNDFTAILANTENSIELNNSEKKALDNWKNGLTENALVNHFANELKQHGYISHSARQLLAHYLIVNMNISWRFGAAHFEEYFIDFCPASNWGNWMLLAGVGLGDKSNNISFDKLAKQLDPLGKFASVV